MSTTSSAICAAADALQGLVGFNAKSGAHIVRFSEDSFGLDVPEDTIQPCAEFVWQPLKGELMTLSRERLGLLLEQRIDDRLNISEPLRVYLRRSDLPEIIAERRKS
ncbi:MULTISPECIES: DUF2025 family protein [unclassified Pseudomonas]|uniref:DUF2025 family protein n=1 Tax=unclassified Pseudomonas TaxID=196821 RepID=UPI002449ED3C|nr:MULTISPECIES: DUF2025 family protein [unclassified Pseudomonas]MDG9926955.1 DUF2025 family protein [Pseudomonas sp. GD04042]MDH0484598.1 DUF2025 family protein [Pseudomonas sp. GD04015]MDH0602370.1 DUF2025 family protein [Pseudomonas sp. GD03869]